MHSAYILSQDKHKNGINFTNSLLYISFPKFRKDSNMGHSLIFQYSILTLCPSPSKVCFKTEWAGDGILSIEGGSQFNKIFAIFLFVIRMC